MQVYHLCIRGWFRGSDTIENDGIQNLGMVAHQELTEQRAVRLAIVNDFVVAQRLANVIDVGRILVEL